MKRMAPDQRREAIVAAALDVAVRKGLASTTVRDVAAEMGTSSGLIHHYFDSMDEVLAAAFERVAAQDLGLSARLMAEAASPVEALRVFFRTYTPADKDWAFQLWLDAWAEAARRPAVQATSRRLNLEWQALLERTIRAGVGEGSFSCADPAAAAWRVLSLLDGLALQVVAHGTTITRDEVVAWATGAAETRTRPGAPGVAFEGAPRRDGAADQGCGEPVWPGCDRSRRGAAPSRARRRGRRGHPGSPRSRPADLVSNGGTTAFDAMVPRPTIAPLPTPISKAYRQGIRFSPANRMTRTAVGTAPNTARPRTRVRSSDAPPERGSVGRSVGEGRRLARPRILARAGAEPARRGPPGA